jgi:hypothetical protein
MAVRGRAGPGEGSPSIQSAVRRRIVDSGARSGLFASFSICFAVGIRQDAGWSVMTGD